MKIDKPNFAFSKKNYIICAVAFIIVLLGFVLMTGPASTIEGGFEPDIFSTRRIVIAPMTCFFGFLLMIVGILYKGKDEENKNTNNIKTNK